MAFGLLTEGHLILLTIRNTRPTGGINSTTFIRGRFEVSRGGRQRCPVSLGIGPGAASSSRSCARPGQAVVAVARLNGINALLHVGVGEEGGHLFAVKHALGQRVMVTRDDEQRQQRKD